MFFFFVFTLNWQCYFSGTALWSGIFFATDINHIKIMKNTNDRLIGCFDKINQMLNSIALTFMEHMQKNTLNNRNEFEKFVSFQWSITCTVQCAICGEGINSQKKTKIENEKQNELIFYLFFIAFLFFFTLPDPFSFTRFFFSLHTFLYIRTSKHRNMIFYYWFFFSSASIYCFFFPF